MSGEGGSTEIQNGQVEGFGEHGGILFFFFAIRACLSGNLHGQIAGAFEEERKERIEQK